MQFEDKGIVGPDLSFYQTLRDDRGIVIEYVNFQKMKEWRNENGNGINFIIIKAGQRNYADPDFKYNWSRAGIVGIPRAPYWFLDYRAEGKAQAAFFWNLIKDDPGEGPLIVDFEDGSGGWRGLWDFLVRLQVLSGYLADRIWIYTGYYYWQSFGPTRIGEEASLREFMVYGLWLAAYADTPDFVLVPHPWTTAKMWQKGTTIVWGPNLGVHSLELDWNVFNGDMNEFKKYWITDYIPVPEPNEGGNEEMKYKVVWSNGVARRTKPTTSNSYTGLVYSFFSEVDVVEGNIQDELDPNNNNKKWVKFADGYFGASEYPDSAGVPRIRMEKVVDEPVPPDPGPTPSLFEPFVLKVNGFKQFEGELEKV